MFMGKNSLLFTGASGFLGANTLRLLSNSYIVKTLGTKNTNDYKVNLAKEVPSFNEQFNVVLHAAGKAHSIPKTQKERNAFFYTNLQGTKNLCYALEKNGLPDSFIFVSTVAVYGLEYGEQIKEDNPLKGNTPYALSKLQAEEFLLDWSEKHGVRLAIIRPPLIAGYNPPGNLGAMIKGIKTGKYLSISGGKARKSVLMAQDIANLVPKLAEKGGIYNVCDTENLSFRDLEKIIAKQLNKPISLSIPLPAAKIMAHIGDLIGRKAPINTKKLNKITKSLTFSNEKARHELEWNPLNVRENFRIG